MTDSYYSLSQNPKQALNVLEFDFLNFFLYGSLLWSLTKGYVTYCKLKVTAADMNWNEHRVFA